jgi:hypothetical protein
MDNVWARRKKSVEMKGARSKANAAAQLYGLRGKLG